MARETLFVALGPQRYRVERPWGDLPATGGLVSGVACDARGHLFVLLRHDGYVGDRGRPAVVELSPEGERLAAWGGDVIADGHLMAAGPEGRLYVADRDAHQILIFDRTGRPVGTLGARHRPGAPFSHPADVAVAPWGDLYVADGYAATLVHRFGADLAPRGRWGEAGAGPGGFSTPHAVWGLRDGRVAVADRENDRVQIFSAEGAFLAAWGGHYRPMDIVEDAAGRILVTDQVPRLTALAPDGSVLGRCRPVLNGAHGVACDGAGRIYLAELNPSRLTRLVPVGDGDG